MGVGERVHLGHGIARPGTAVRDKFVEDPPLGDQPATAAFGELVLVYAVSSGLRYVVVTVIRHLEPLREGPGSGEFVADRGSRDDVTALSRLSVGVLIEPERCSGQP